MLYFDSRLNVTKTTSLFNNLISSVAFIFFADLESIDET